jgi:hypothetical protein
VPRHDPPDTTTGAELLPVLLLELPLTEVGADWGEEIEEPVLTGTVAAGSGTVVVVVVVVVAGAAAEVEAGVATWDFAAVAVRAATTPVAAAAAAPAPNVTRRTSRSPASRAWAERRGSWLSRLSVIARTG